MFSVFVYALIVATDVPNTCFTWLPRSALGFRATGGTWSRGVQSQQTSYLSIICALSVGAGEMGGILCIYHFGWADIAGDEDYCNGVRFHVQSQIQENTQLCDPRKSVFSACLRSSNRLPFTSSSHPCLVIAEELLAEKNDRVTH